MAGVRASHVVLDVIQEGTAMRKCSEMFTTVGKHGGQAVHNHVSQWGMNIGDVTFTPTQGHALESSGASPGQSAPLSLPGCHWEREQFKGGRLDRVLLLKTARLGELGSMTISCGHTGPNPVNINHDL